MRAHKFIWIITAVIVGATVLVVATRRPAPSNGAPPLADPTPAQAKLLIQNMLSCLDDDPQARRSRTRNIVEAVAILAEEGVMETAETYFALGLLRYGQRWNNTSLGKSEEAFRKAIKLNPDWALPYNGLGLTLMYLERYEEAEASFRRAIQLDPDWSRPHNDLAVLLRHTDRLDEAEAEALIALSLDPDSVANNNNYGNVLLKRGRL
ncbi:MAG: tetratricopeptide repeat protein, partial [Candidatus Hydrogenedentota bacterium]